MIDKANEIIEHKQIDIPLNGMTTCKLAKCPFYGQWIHPGHQHDIVEEDNNDPVNHPKHYTSHPSGVECIDITRHMGFNLGNAMKYLWRNGLKDNEPDIQDLEKAIWYIQDEIKYRRLVNG